MLKTVGTSVSGMPYLPSRLTARSHTLSLPKSVAGASCAGPTNCTTPDWVKPCVSSTVLSGTHDHSLPLFTYASHSIHGFSSAFGLRPNVNCMRMGPLVGGISNATYKEGDGQGIDKKGRNVPPPCCAVAVTSL